MHICARYLFSVNMSIPKWIVHCFQTDRFVSVKLKNRIEGRKQKQKMRIHSHPDTYFPHHYERLLCLYKPFIPFLNFGWMEKLLKQDGLLEPMVGQILSAFNVPKTPRQVEKELKLSKIKMKPLIENKMVVPLNPSAKKGRLYVNTKKARSLIDLSECKNQKYRKWDLVGWIMASPKQRLVVIKSMDKMRRTSEKIRERASKANPHLSRTSTKGILKELHCNGLIETEMIEGKRYYWMNDKGKSILSDIHQFCP